MSAASIQVAWPTEHHRCVRQDPQQDHLFSLINIFCFYPLSLQLCKHLKAAFLWTFTCVLSSSACKAVRTLTMSTSCREYQIHKVSFDDSVCSPSALFPKTELLLSPGLHVHQVSNFQIALRHCWCKSALHIVDGLCTAHVRLFFCVEQSVQAQPWNPSACNIKQTEESWCSTHFMNINCFHWGRRATETLARNNLLTWYNYPEVLCSESFNKFHTPVCS